MMQFQPTRLGLIALSLVLVTAGTTLAWFVQEKQPPRKIKRVRRPVFKERDWDGIYFEDLFRDGLVGPRPKKLTAEQLAAQNKPEDATASQLGAENKGSGWSQWISGPTIEDEVKALQQQLAVDITTPGKFKTDYNKVHQSYSILSMLFAIIGQYDGDVRWKQFSGPAQASFERAAANSRVGTIQAYESCKRRAQQLQDMVRGGNFSGTDKPAETLDWSQVVGHSPVMEQLEISYEALKQLTARESQFNESMPEVLHLAELIAAMSHTIQQPSMEYGEEEGYVEYARQMRDAAAKVSKSCRNNDFESASNAVNLIGQTCTNCHEEWR
jgi:hypothetical protein